MIKWVVGNDMGLRQKVIAICAERESGAEKEPIMLCRIADRGLLFGYLGNKMLSLYEDWREERDSFFIPSQQANANLVINLVIRFL